MVQRAIERRGIPTASPPVALDVTNHAKPPRALFLPFMMGHHFGVPFHTDLQTDILKRLLLLIESAKESGQIESFPMTWAEARKQGKQIEKQIGTGG